MWQIRYMDQNDRFVSWIVIRKQKNSDKIIVRGNHRCSYWEMWVWFSWQININKQFLDFVTIRIMMEESEKVISNRIILQKRQDIEWYFGERNQVYRWWEIVVQISIKIIMNSVLKKQMTIRIPMQGTELIFLQ